MRRVYTGRTTPAPAQDSHAATPRSRNRRPRRIRSGPARRPQTDSDGNREHNVDLSRRRAESVKKYLVAKGIAEGRLSTRGAGPDEPIAKNDTKKNKALNRRIEFKLQEGELASK
jgi:hypothetical protein